jgi:hypothetical protein
VPEDEIKDLIVKFVGVSGALRTLPDAPHRAPHLPETPICHHQMILSDRTMLYFREV